MHALAFQTHTKCSFWPRRRRFCAKLALRTPVVHTLARAFQGGPARTNRHHRAVTTTCRAGGVPFVCDITNTNSHRLAPSSGQFLVRGTGFRWQLGRLRRLVWREARNAMFFVGAAMPTEGNAAHRFWQERVCLQRLGQPPAAQRCGVHAWVLANAVALCECLRCWTELQREQCLSMGGRRKNSSTSVPGAVGVLAAYGTVSRSLTM